MIVKLVSEHPAKFVRKVINNTPYYIEKSPTILPDEYLSIFEGDNNFDIVQSPKKVEVPKPAAPKAIPKPESKKVEKKVEEPKEELKEEVEIKKKFFGVK